MEAKVTSVKKDTVGNEFALLVPLDSKSIEGWVRVQNSLNGGAAMVDAKSDVYAMNGNEKKDPFSKAERFSIGMI